MSDQSIFDQILERKIPATIVFEDEHVLAFDDTNPQAPTHVLVIPKKKYQGILELETADPLVVGEYMRRIPMIARELGLASDGYRVVFNQGIHGQQTVPYIHAHILGGTQLNWPPC